MSKASKISLLIALVAVIAYAVMHLIFGHLPAQPVALGVAGLAFAASIYSDRRLWAEFLTMRTTKHGMNMGAVIVLMTLGVVCVNYLAIRHNKTWDLTAEHLNSLSDQSRQILDGLKDDLRIKYFYRGSGAAEGKQGAQSVFNLYKEYSGRVRVSYHNALVDEDAIGYLKDQPDVRSGMAFAFVEYGEKRIRIEEPIDESQVTSALIRATRTGDTKVYFVKGHGERDLTGQNEIGASALDKALKEASFKTEALDLVEKKTVPEDAAVVALLGPSQAYLEDEMEALRKFAKRGGHLFVALDPGQHHNLANLVRPLGVEFANNYVLSFTMQIQGAGPSVILGRTFDSFSPITANFPPGSSFGIFPITSELKPVADKDGGFETHELVKTDASTVTVNDPSQIKKRDLPEGHASTLAISVTGKGEGDKKYELVAFGNSTFLTNRFLSLGVNRDLVLNTFAQLANQKDLISIKPKQAAGTNLVLTPAKSWAIGLLTLFIPLALLVASLVIWYRRRGA